MSMHLLTKKRHKTVAFDLYFVEIKINNYYTFENDIFNNYKKVGALGGGGVTFEGLGVQMTPRC